MTDNDITAATPSNGSAAAALPRRLEQAGERASQLAQRGLDALSQGSQQLREGAREAGEHTRGYIRTQPLKSMLIAAAAGAVLAGLLGLLARGNAAR